MGEMADYYMEQDYEDTDDYIDSILKNKRKMFNEIMNKGKNKVVPKKITKKYYVGKASVAGTDHCKATLQEAIDHAKEYVESTGDDQIVVQIVRVVRRMKPPISVEKV